MSSDQEQRFTTQKGDTLLALCRRVYGVHEQERVYQVATIVAAFHPDNVAVVKGKVSAELAPGKVIVYPPWALVATKLAALEKTSPPPPERVVAKSALVAPVFRQVGLSPKVPLSRSLPKALADHTGLTPSQAHDKIRPISKEALDPMRTIGPEVLNLRQAGDTLAKALPETTVKELLATGNRGVEQNLLLMLRDLSPRNFPPSADASFAISVISEGFGLALMARVANAAKLELDRRFLRLQTLLASGSPELPASDGRPASKVLGGGLDGALQALTTAIAGEPPSLVTPRILADCHQRFGVIAGSRLGDLLRSQPCAPNEGLAAFLDDFGPATSDGPLAEALYALCNPTKDTQREAITIADRRLALVEPELAVLLGKETPNAAIGKISTALMTKWRQTRTAETADNDLAEERRMLAGRNYLSFRKDIALAIDNRLAQSPLSPRQKATVALAVLTAIGHRLAGMRADEIEAAVERFAVAAGS